MNRIKIISILLIVVLCTSCSKDDYKLGSEINPFLRFHFLKRSDNTPLEYPATNGALTPQNSYVNNSIKTLKVPVALTAHSLKNEVTANFSVVSSTNDNEVVKVNPVNELVFKANKLTDTIFVSFENRWKENQSVTLKLETVSDPAIHIGNLNTELLNDTFKIDLGEITTRYSIGTNYIEIKGEIGETVDFKVNFPNGYFPSELENLEIFNFINGFEYSLTHDHFEINKNSVTYHLTLLKDIQNDDVRYETFITLNPTQSYTTTGNTILQISKPTKVPRDVQANPAAIFYKTNLTYGVNWFERNGACAWFPFNSVGTYPIVVTKNNPNAIQYSGQNTPDTSDDVYHDAFKIGFNVAAGTNTTNSFGLKNWFTNESVSAANSPGFNITSALEFFPENGNSKTRGNILVIPQFIIIGSSAENRHSIFISGEGTYKDIGNGFFEISFELKLKNDTVFKEYGGTVISKYRIYNKTGYPTLTPLNDSCYKPFPL